MQILAKVKEKGFKKSVQIVVDKFINYINQYFILIFRNLSIIDTLIVFESEGDYTDNAQALYQYMLDNGYLKKYKIEYNVLKKNNDNLKFTRKESKVVMLLLKYLEKTYEDKKSDELKYMYFECFNKEENDLFNAYAKYIYLSSSLFLSS